MRLKFVICKVLQKEAYLCAARSGNIVDIVLMEQGLHNTPDALRTEVQKELEKLADVAGNKYDAILLGYGLCGNGITGLRCAIPLVVPRAHDCITLLLGSLKRHLEYQENHRGVYWYSDGWIGTGTMPGRERYEKLLAEYTEKYGSDNAAYLIETEQSWMKEYGWAAYIDWGFAGAKEQKEYTRRCAKYLGWRFDAVKGESGLLQRLVDGDWNSGDFLIIKPGQEIQQDLTSAGLIRADDCQCTF